MQTQAFKKTRPRWGTSGRIPPDRVFGLRPNDTPHPRASEVMWAHPLCSLPPFPSQPKLVTVAEALVDTTFIKEVFSFALAYRYPAPPGPRIEGPVVRVVRSRAPAISAICLPIQCPEFLGRRVLGDENAAFLEDSVSRFLGHRISNVRPIFSLDVPPRSYHHAMKCHRDKWPSSPPQSRLNSSTPRWLLPWGPGRAIAKKAGHPTTRAPPVG